MHFNKSLKSIWIAASVFVLAALLNGCNDEDHSKPDLNDVKSAVQKLYGECPLWTLSSVRRIDGAPNQNGYEISYSFVLTMKDPGVLVGRPANASKEDNLHVAASMFGDSSDPCFYGLFPLAAAAHQAQLPLSNSYQGSGDRIFAQSEQGWHLNASPVNPRDMATYDQFGPIDDAAAAALQASSADADAGASARTGAVNGGQSIFHRLNMLVMSLLHIGGSHSDEPTSATTQAADVAAASANSAPAASQAEQVANTAAVTNTASVAAPSDASATTADMVSVPAAPLAVAPTASTAAPAVSASTTSPAQDGANGDQAEVASQVQAAKLQLLVQKAQAEFDTAQYRSAVATAEAILLLDPDNTQAQQLRSKALRLASKQATAPAIRAQPPKPTVTQAPTTAPTAPPVQQPASHPLGVAELEGDWRGTYQCGPYVGSGTVSDPNAWTRHIAMTVRNGQATLVRQSTGERAFREVLSGNVAADLSLHLTGTGQNAVSQHPWSDDFVGHFAGTTEQATFQADGALSNWLGEKFRTCQLALSR